MGIVSTLLLPLKINESNNSCNGVCLNASITVEDKQKQTASAMRIVSTLPILLKINISTLSLPLKINKRNNCCDGDCFKTVVTVEV